MTFTQLKYFLTLTEYLSFTRAANSLFISQTTLSQHIANLEEELDSKLFLRSRSGLQITPEGEYLKKVASIVVSEIDSLPDAMRELHDPSQAIPKTFSVAVDSITFSQDSLLLAKLIKGINKFSSKYPQMEFTVCTYKQENMIKALLDKSIDIAVGLVELISYEKIRVIEIKNQPINLMLKYKSQQGEDLLNAENIKKILEGMDIYTLNFSPTHNQAIMQWLEKIGCENELNYVYDPWQLQINMVLQNIAAFIPPHCLLPEFDFTNFVSITIPELHIPRHVAWNAENSHPLIGQFLKELL